MSARERWPQLSGTLRRMCGGACRVAMDQLPGLPDPELREAFASWSWVDEPDPPGAQRSVRAAGGRGAATGLRAAAQEESR
jgi:hypothetical protein